MLHNPVTQEAFFVGKIPYLFRRRNIYYFRIRVPAEHQQALNATEIVRSLKTESRHEAIPLALQLAANVALAFNELKSGTISDFSASELMSRGPQNQLPATVSPITVRQNLLKSPLLSVVVADFLNRYNPKNKPTLTKLKSTLPVFIELIGDKPINTILQADVNNYFDQVQKLPVRRDAKIFRGMSIKEIIATHDGRCIAEGTFESTYRAMVSMFINWAAVHYKDQGFPNLSVNGAVYRGNRANGINKQRSLTLDQIRLLFTHPKMKQYAADRNTAHCCWLPLIGLFTGARLNEVCQLNPFTDIKQDAATGIWYFHFTDETESAVLAQT
ncbi:DUF6538 domain-containing protein [Methylomonas sp. BW4-1]|uniref:DUF6538 domain-containing protein n=1 Tax=Methylomonas sp. BW4-1 TaxID=3376685 RepID=UPI004041868B